MTRYSHWNLLPFLPAVLHVSFFIFTQGDRLVEYPLPAPVPTFHPSLEMHPLRVRRSAVSWVWLYIGLVMWGCDILSLVYALSLFSLLDCDRTPPLSRPIGSLRQSKCSFFRSPSQETRSL
ncbi:hypothetical protein FA13DRAFT_96886 [Coprinellus micaceus]|uniref:Uncharacterized protein n=1 Tax=Coprinellus micaceus TaxID=71717 RepID=A0A4Y7SIN7_COPMI|nr:hypothetical protein FA13DRAFT_96886 [Coprinellus micaceus]